MIDNNSRLQRGLQRGLPRRTFLGLAGLAGLAAMSLLGACSPSTALVGPHEPDADTACALDGMTLNNYPGPKGQIQYKEGKADFFCDLPDLFSVLLAPEQKRAIAGVYVQDVGVADWNKPRGHWIDAKTALYVAGSRKTGSMGATYGAFSDAAAATAFARQEGGRVLKFGEITLATAKG